MKAEPNAMHAERSMDRAALNQLCSQSGGELTSDTRSSVTYTFEFKCQVEHIQQYVSWGGLSSIRLGHKLVIKL